MTVRHWADDFEAKRCVHMGSLLGHRRAYQNLFIKLFDMKPSHGRVGRRNFGRLVGSDALLFGTIDDDYSGFFAVALTRALLGRRTVGLFIRPQTCFRHDALIYRFKKWAFMALKPIPLISVFTIVPFSAAPQYKMIATGGVIDPQMWDLNEIRLETLDLTLAENIRSVAKGRRVLAFIGTVNIGKGIEFLRGLTMSPTWPHDKILVVVAGHFPEGTQHLVKELINCGALVINRFISDSELSTLYAEADFIWACYRPDYDQASGIFGRALQLMKIPVVRSGSLIAAITHHLPVSAIELEYGDIGEATKLTTSCTNCYDGAAFATTIATWKHDFEKAIGSVL